MRVPAPGVKIGNSTRSNNKEERNLMNFMEIPDQVKKKESGKSIQSLVGESTQGKGTFPFSGEPSWAHMRHFSFHDN